MMNYFVLLHIFQTMQDEGSLDSSSHRRSQRGSNGRCPPKFL